MRYVLIVLLFFSCAAPVVDENKLKNFDSNLVKPLHDSVALILPIAEKVIVKTQRSIIRKMEEAEKQADSLKKENSELKELTKITKTVIVRDTIYIKEKINFWGKKRVTSDSSSTVDSIIIEQ